MKKLLIPVLFVTLFAACNKEEEVPNCSYDPCAVKAPASEIQQVKDYLASRNINATQHCSGLFYTISNAGTGATPGICNGVTVQYTGRLTDGQIFDQTTTRPATFGLNGLIEGWKKGIPLIKQGGTITLYIPPSLGYGPNAQTGGRVPIPANSILIFEIQLDAVL